MPNHYDFAGRVALVTGGASGIGAAAVERLRDGGADVHVFDLANGDDVRDSAQLNGAVERLPRLDVLVCCAGVGGDSLHTEDVGDEEWERVHAINLDGVFYANRAALPKMKAGGYGRIVNVASIAGKEGNPMAGPYSSSKAAVIALTKAIGKDVAGTGVLVNCIAPAVINTPILAQISEEHIGYMTARIPLGRVGEPGEVAALICWLASEEMSFSTPGCFDTSGGGIRARRDSRGSVPEPELGVVIGEGGTRGAVTIGNDVASRDIEGASPLYIPQAKIYRGGCAIGPALLVPNDWSATYPIRMRIANAAGEELFTGETSTAKLKRSPQELVEWVMRDNPVPPGSVLLTGTGLVPPDDYTLEPGHVVEIAIEGIGVLVNHAIP